MAITVYGIRNCDTVRKALDWLDQRGVDYSFHDYRKSGAPSDRLAAWADLLGWEQLANTRGTTWRKIPEAERAALDRSRMLALLKSQPSAIRRPAVEWQGGGLTLGFDPAAFARSLDQ